MTVATRVVKVDAQAPDPRIVAEAAAVLARGGLVAIPTETVYGLGARALDERALARVFEAKGRPAHHPLIAHVLDEAQARSLAASWPERASRLARAFWPGALTIVVERSSRVPAAIAGGSDSIAVRAPSHPVARAVIAALGEPVAAPSANRFQRLSPTTAQHVVDQLGGGVDLVLDAGPCEAGIESTVVDVRGDHPRVLRPGVVGLGALRAIAPDIEAMQQQQHAQREDLRVSPGMDPRHYAPRAKLVVAPTCDEAERIAFGLAAEGARVGLVMHEARSESAVEHEPMIVRMLPRDPAQYARLLYRTLQDLDDLRVEVIVVQGVPDEDAWWAVADRLRRGSTRA